MYFTLKAVGAVGTFLGNMVGATDAVTVGEAETALMVAAETEAKFASCSPATAITEKHCGDLRVLVVDASRMPFIARNTKLAWESGRPAILTMNRGKIRSNRAAACPKSFPTPHGGQCDEYPMASTEEGGVRARREEVPPRENRCQGGMYGAQYPPDGERFLVVISKPDLVATGPFTGSDIAADQGCR